MFQSKFTKTAPVSLITLERDTPELLEEGVTDLRILDILDLGTQHSVYGDRRKLVIVMEAQNQPSVKYPGQLKQLRTTMTASLNEKANFAIFCGALGFDTAVTKFNVAQLKDVRFQGNVVTAISEKTKIAYSNLSGIIPGSVRVPGGRAATAI